MPRRVMRGTVVGDKADKTVIVRVEPPRHAPALQEGRAPLQALHRP